MEFVGLAASAVTLAALFSNCIECFSYFKAAQGCPAEAEILLVKLDCEKARLLVWANNVGILQTDARKRHAQLADSANHILIKRCIEQIITLLTDAQKLQDEYGSQHAAQGNEQRNLTVMSANSMNAFKPTRLKFFAKVAIPRDTPGWVSRFKWAIRDAGRFQTLVLHLRDFVDNIIQLLPLPPDLITNSISEDITTIVDIGALRLTESACDQSYPAWSAQAGQVIRDSEIGTVDRRNFEELFNDTTDGGFRRDTQAESQPPRPMAPVTQPAEICFMVATDPCLDLDGNSLCQSSKIQSMFHYGREFSVLGVDYGSWNIGRRIMAHVRSPFDSRKDLDAYEQRYFEQSQTSDEDPTYPIRSMIYIYCGPCAYAIGTALQITVRNAASEHFGFAVRIEHRLKTTCRHQDSVADVLDALHEGVEKHVSRSNLDFSRAIGYIDVPYLEKQLYDLEEDSLDTHVSAVNTSLPEIMAEANGNTASNIAVGAVIFVVEDSLCQLFMESYPIQATARKPRATEIYGFTRLYTSREALWARKFLGRHRRSADALKKIKAQQDAISSSTDLGTAPTARPPISNGPSPSSRKRQKLSPPETT